MFFLCSLIRNANTPEDRNSTSSLCSMARMIFQPMSSNNVQPSAVSSRSFIKFSKCTNQNLASFLPLLTMTSSTFLCSSHPPFHTMPGPSAPLSWSQWRRISALDNATMLSPLSASTSTQDLDSSRTSMSMFATRAPTPNHKNSSIEFPLGSPPLPISILLPTQCSIHSTRTP